MKPLLLALFAAGAASLHAQSLIDVTFPDGTGTNPTFLEIDNGVGDNFWTQSTGVLSSSTSNNSSIGAASDTTIAFSTLGTDSLVLSVDVASVTGISIANGMFIGFQRRNNAGTGADLWNNLPTSFGLVLPGSASVGLGVRQVAVGGNNVDSPGRYQFGPSYGQATLESIQNGFSLTLTINSTGWDLAVSGLEDAGAVAITGGTGAWSVDGISDWDDFTDDMRVGMSYQTNAGAGDVSLAAISLTTLSNADTDEDGMPDRYEDAHGLNKNDPADASQGADDGLFDNDGLTNLEEFTRGTDPNEADVDMDLLNDGEEIAIGTNPLIADTDMDGLNDGDEVNGTLNPYHVGHSPGTPPGGAPGAPTDPLDFDGDFDGVSDFEELDNSNGSVSDPNNFDTDGDTLEDGYEIDNGLDPTDPTGDNGPSGDLDKDNLSNADEQLEGTRPDDPDSDGDGINDGDEVNGTLNPYQVGHTPGTAPGGAPGEPTNPLDRDTDFDGLDDFAEIDGSNGSVSDPNNFDTDDDGLEDGYEVFNGLDPTDATGNNGLNGDPDNDGLTNFDEQAETTDPQNPDTDGDGLNDGDEVTGALNPWFGGTSGPLPGEATDPLDADSDSDGVDDLDEINADNGFSTDPLNPDTDGDFLTDGFELTYALDPTDPTGENGADGDPDADTLTNLEEQDFGSNPRSADSDNDTLSDVDEIFTHLTDPARADTDRDLLADNVELENTFTDPLIGDSDLDGFKDFIEVEAGSDPNIFESTPTFPTITWAVEALDAEADLSTAGSLLYAYNFHGVDATANGILFTGHIDDEPEKSSLHVQTLLNLQSAQNLYDNEVPALAPLLETFWYDPSQNAINVGLTGLTPGQTYLVQFGRSDDRSDASILDRYMVVDFTFGGNIAEDPVGPTNTIYGGPNNPSVLFTGTFTASSTVQVFAWQQFLPDGTFSAGQLPFLQVRKLGGSGHVMVTKVEHTGSSVMVSFLGLDPAKNYQLVRSANLEDSFPTVVDGPRLPAGSTDTYTDATPPAGEAYYQLEVMP